MRECSMGLLALASMTRMSFPVVARARTTSEGAVDGRRRMMEMGSIIDEDEDEEDEEDEEVEEEEDDGGDRDVAVSEARLDNVGTDVADAGADDDDGDDDADADDDNGDVNDAEDCCCEGASKVTNFLNSNGFRPNTYTLPVLAPATTLR